MKNLLKKEFSLCMHPTVLIFLSFSFMFIIPNYPYYVIFFYNGLALFFTCLSGRENNDIEYSLNLPIAKKDIIKARLMFASLVQIAQVIISVPFIMIRQAMPLPGNQVGMDANIALIGLSLIMMGLFNLVFFGSYYKNVRNVGKPFAIGSTVVFVYIIIAETCCHIIPFLKNYLDTKDTEYVGYKILVLLISIALYILLTFITYKKSVTSFEKYDI